MQLLTTRNLVSFLKITKPTLILLVAIGFLAPTAHACDPTVESAPSTEKEKVKSKATMRIDVKLNLFDSGEKQLGDDAKNSLNEFAKALQEDTNAWGVVEISIYRGARESLKLSEERMNAVVQFLVESGIPQSRLRTNIGTDGKGEVELSFLRVSNSAALDRVIASLGVEP